MRYALRLALTVLAALPVIAAAGGKATIETGAAPGPEMEIVWQDSDTLRLQEAGDSDYFIVRDGTTYLVNVGKKGDDVRVIDMASMVKVMGGATGQSSENGVSDIGEVGSVEANGKTETVAGVTGRVYHMTWTSPNGETRTQEIVLTDDATVVEMTRAYVGSIQALLADSRKIGGLLRALPDDDRGVLRIGDQFEVQSISAASPPDSTFELPAEPVDLEKLMGRSAGE